MPNTTQLCLIWCVSYNILCSILFIYAKIWIVIASGLWCRGTGVSQGVAYAKVESLEATDQSQGPEGCTVVMDNWELFMWLYWPRWPSDSQSTCQSVSRIMAWRWISEPGSTQYSPGCSRSGCIIIYSMDMPSGPPTSFKNLEAVRRTYDCVQFILPLK